MTVRPARSADLPSIVEVEKLCFPQETAFPSGMFDFLIANARTLVAAEEDVVMGFVIGYASGRTGFIYTLDVHPRFQGRGLGRSLMQQLEKVLYADGARFARLEVALVNPSAIKLYRRLGYEGGEVIKDYYGFGGHAIRLWKTLSAPEGDR